MSFLKITNILFDAINLAYSKDLLMKSLFPLAVEFLQKNKEFCIQQGIDERFFDYALRKVPKKEEVVWVCCVPLSNKTVFNKFREQISANLRKLIDELVWVEELDDIEIKKRYGIEVTTSVKSSWGTRTELKPQYYLFSVKMGSSWYGSTGGATLCLDARLREILLEYYEKPLYFNLIPVSELPEMDYVFEGEKTIHEELTRLIIYHHQNNIKTSNKNEVVPSTLAKMQRQLSITEFYKESKNTNLSLLRTQLLASLLVLDREYVFIEKNTTKYLKTAFFLYANIHDPMQLLTYLKGKSEPLNDILYRYINLISLLPVGEWISVENIIKYIRYHAININPTDFVEYHRNIYYTSSPYGERNYITATNFHSLVVLPAFKANFFLLAAWGMMDIAYTLPQTDSSDNQTNIYDGLAYVRFNSLGAYLFNITQTYTPPQRLLANPPSLSTESLFITTDPKDVTSDIFFAPYANKIGENRYKTDYNTFLNGCLNAHELQNKIDNFKEVLDGTPLPENWIEFFDTLQKKSNPFDIPEANKVISIAKTQPELIKLIVQDPILSKLVIKAEYHHLIIPQKNIAKVKQRLREFGYLWEG